MKNLLKKPTSEISDDKKTRYEIFNLKENPFPNTPFVNKVSPDDRYNGRIYESKIREAERTQIIENFVKEPQSNPNHIRLGYIIDNSYVGRGNGKSAFTLDLIDKINFDYSLDISNDVNKCFGLHISPLPSGKSKTFYDFVDLIFEEIINKNLINYCLASLRLEVIIEKFSDQIDLEKDFEDQKDLVSKLNSSHFFKGKNFTISDITREFYQKKEFSKISADFILNRDKNNFYGSNVANQDDFKKYFEGLKKGKQRIDFIFNDLVLFFEASGFNGSYIIIDDFERIPDFQSEKLKQEFALEIRTNFFDGVLENARIGFYNLILVLHAGVPRLVEKSWSTSGMERRSPMLSENGDISKHIIYFNKLNYNQARSLLEIYLEKYRIHPTPENKIFPFTEKAIELIAEKSEYNASTILERAFSLIEKAIIEEIAEINDVYVNEKLGKKDDWESDFQNDISKEDSDDLFSKSKKQ
ncbi:hypothetical protein ACFX5E_07925 [Flavobacterium sp. LS2P90]|uniref:Uncharacterized protein n=1 Tax=Flavobacterium xylosi TaxID=3230415 RepID=A0ABW6HVG8_9FLAO